MISIEIILSLITIIVYSVAEALQIVFNILHSPESKVNFTALHLK